MKATIQSSFAEVHRQNPLIHHITNAVTINDCANITLAIGGSPVMADSPEEAAEMTDLANALVVNFGTLHAQSFEAMFPAGKRANEKGIPIVFDPVGVGATTIRTEMAQLFLQKVKVQVIRGNVTEILALIQNEANTRGVDAGDTDIDRGYLAKTVASKFGCVVVISGKTDIVSDGSHVVAVHNGTPKLTKVTGTGCMSTSLIANFASVLPNLLHAAVAGISVMGIAGEMAESALQDHEGLGTFRIKLFDYVSLMTGVTWKEAVRIHE